MTKITVLYLVLAGGKGATGATNKAWENLCCMHQARKNTSLSLHLLVHVDHERPHKLPPISASPTSTSASYATAASNTTTAATITTGVAAAAAANVIAALPLLRVALAAHERRSIAGRGPALPRARCGGVETALLRGQLLLRRRFPLPGG